MESLSSNNSLSFLDVKGRPNRSSLSAPESDKAPFPDPQANRPRAESSDEVEKLSEPSDGPTELATNETDASESKSKDEVEWEGVDPAESDSKAKLVDSQEHEDRGIDLSNAVQEVDPETVPSGSFGVIAEESVAPIPFELMETVPQTEGGEKVMEQAAPQVLTSEAQVATSVEVGQTMAAPTVAAQVVGPKVVPELAQTTSAQHDVNPAVAQAAPVAEAPTGGFDQSQDFGQAQSDASFGELATEFKGREGVSIESVIQDARIESIALDSRPAMQAKPVQNVQAVAQTLSNLPGRPVEQGEAILGQVQARIQPSMNRAVLRLTPEALGRVGIAITVEAGEVRADMRVESAESLQALQKYIPELKAMFAQADLELSELNLQLDSDGSGFEWEDEAFADEQTWGSRQAAQETKSDASQGAEPNRLSRMEGGLDLIA